MGRASIVPATEQQPHMQPLRRRGVNKMWLFNTFTSVHPFEDRGDTDCTYARCIFNNITLSIGLSIDGKVSLSRERPRESLTFTYLFCFNHIILFFVVPVVSLTILISEALTDRVSVTLYPKIVSYIVKESVKCELDLRREGSVWWCANIRY